MSKANVVLIGMPGAGKSTVGVVLAKRLGLAFIDVDVVIQSRQGRRLQQLIDAQGLAAFRRIEEETLLGLPTSGTVIATGGSAVYSEIAMATLQASGTVVFLEVPLATLEGRVRDMDQRGLVMEAGETFADLFRRRQPLYRRWADLTVAAGSHGVEQVVTDICAGLGA